MILYLCVSIFPLFISLLYHRTDFSLKSEKAKRIRKTIWIAIALLPMFTLIAIRGRTIGPDTGVYIEMFLSARDATIIELLERSGNEPGFLLFERCIALLTRNPRVYQIIYSSIYYVCILIFISSFKENNFLMCFLFATLGLYKFLFTGVRQCLAICICLLAYFPLKKRQLFRFVIFVILASLFHKSAVLFIIVYFIYGIKFRKRNLLIYLLVFIFSAILIVPLSPVISYLMGYDYGIESTGTGIIRFVTYLCIVIAFIFYGYYNEFDKEELGLFNISLVVLLFWVLRLITRVAERPSYYFVSYLVVLLSIICPKIFKNAKKESIVFTIIVCALSLFLFLYNIKTSSTYLPYYIF